MSAERLGGLLTSSSKELLHCPCERGAKLGGYRDPIVLRYDLQRRGRSAAFAQLCLRLVAGSLLGDDVPDGTDTKTWVFLDEVTRICRSDALIDLSSLGRSRGVRLLATVQSPAQLTDSYGEHGAKSLRENFGITIICGLPPGENAKEVSENWIGSRVVSMSNANDKMKEWTMPCLSSTEIAGELGHQYDLWGAVQNQSCRDRPDRCARDRLAVSEMAASGLNV